MSLACLRTGGDLREARLRQRDIVAGLEEQRAVEARGVEVELIVLEHGWVGNDFQVGMEREGEDGAGDQPSKSLTGTSWAGKLRAVKVTT